MISFDEYKRISDGFNDYLISDENLEKWFSFFVKQFPKPDNELYIVASLVILEEVEQILYGSTGWYFYNQEVCINDDCIELDTKMEEITSLKSNIYQSVKNELGSDEKVFNKITKLLYDKEVDGNNLPAMYSEQSLNLMQYITNGFT